MRTIPTPRPALLRRLVLAVFVLAFTLQPGVHAAIPVNGYVALGDSFAAGPAISAPGPGPLNCMKSVANYPHLLAAGLVPAEFTDVTCSGADMGHMLTPQRLLDGANAAQLDALNAGTEVVTLQIGANDINLAEVLGNCTSLLPLFAPCRDRYASGGTDEIGNRIQGTGNRLTTLLADIGARAPNATTFVVGYPSILPKGGAGCWPTILMTPADTTFLAGKFQELNAMLESRAEAAGAVFVDTYTPSLGHDACAPRESRWIEPNIPLSPAAPFHPNARGMVGMADAIQVAMDSTL